MPQNSRVLDLACGTGALVFHLKEGCKEVVGVDLDSQKIQGAQKRAEQMGLEHLSFFCADASNLEGFANDSFDVVVLSMAIHQFNPDIRYQVLNEALRVGGLVIIADYCAPMRRSFSGLLAELLERLAGSAHHRAYRDYQKKNGIDGLIAGENLKLTQEIQHSVFHTVLISK